MEYINLNELPFGMIVSAFNDAFSDYEIKVNMTESKLRSMISTRSVRLDHSFGYLEDGRLTAFILNGSRLMDDTLTAYDSGTGVISSLQGKGLGSRLLADVVESLINLGYRKYLLEVLTGNTAAVSVYQKKGFRTLRKLNCYSSAGSDLLPDKGTEKVMDADEVVMEDLKGLLAFRPSWQNSAESVLASPENPAAIVIAGNSSPEAFLILAPVSGNIMQFGFREGSDGLMNPLFKRALSLSETDELKILNVEGSAARENRLLLDAGFSLIVSQFEMEMDI